MHGGAFDHDHEVYSERPQNALCADFTASRQSDPLKTPPTLHLHLLDMWRVVPIPASVGGLLFRALRHREQAPPLLD